MNILNTLQYIANQILKFSRPHEGGRGCQIFPQLLKKLPLLWANANYSFK